MGKQSVEKGFALLSVSGVIIKLISLLFIPLLLSIIGEEGNGLYQAAAQVFAFAYVITNSGTLNAITKMTAEYCARYSEEVARKAFLISRAMLAIIGGIVSILMFIFAEDIASMMNFPRASLSITMLAPSAFLTAVISGYRGYFQGLENFKPRAISQIIEQVSNFVASIGLALLAIKIYGIDNLEYACAGANAGTTVAALVAMIYLIYYSQKNKALKKKKKAKAKEKTFDRERVTVKVALRTFFAYSVPITLSAGLQYAASLVDAWNTKSRLIVAGFDDSMATQMYGYLVKYQQLIYVPLIIIIALASTVLPNLSGSHAINDQRKFRSSLIYAYRWCFIIAIPASMGMGVLSNQIYETIRFGLGSQLLLYGSIVTVLMAITQIQSSVLQGLGKMYTLAWFLLTGIVAKIAVNYFLIAIPGININGAIVGSIVCYVIPVILNEIYIRKHMVRKVKLLTYALKPLTASLAMTFMVYFSYMLYNVMVKAVGASSYISVAIPMFLAIITGLVVFVVIMLLIKGFTQKDLAMIPARFEHLVPNKIKNSLR